MAIVVGGISLPLENKEEDISRAAAKKLKIRPDDIKLLRVKKQSIDSRKPDIKFVYTVHVTLKDTQRQHKLESVHGEAAGYTPPDITYGRAHPGRPVVVGAGPCGLFAALVLAQHGYKPLLLERGCDIARRAVHVKTLTTNGELNEQSNICFGAGGAGAFSDGKLTTRIKDKRAEHVLDVLAAHGAPDQIKYLAKPHTGTEHIRTAVSGIIAKIEALGGQVRYDSRLSGIKTDEGALAGITYTHAQLPQTVDTRAMILAIGHSARDTYEMLHTSGIAMEPKPFAIGLRIEHRREFIDRAQYGDAFAHPRLGAAEYRLASNQQGRGVYTFCMCPGGEVVCSATEQGGVAINGMSYYARDKENSNSAIVVGVGRQDFPPGVLGGVDYQRSFERAAFSMTGGYGAPVQKFGDFAAGKITSAFDSILPSYQPYTKRCDLRDCLPAFAPSALSQAISHFGRKIKGFDMPDAVLTGVETRTSSPVRILRRKGLQSLNLAGLFPAGEGAGYAGGIVSAAVDGIKCAEALMHTFARPE